MKDPAEYYTYRVRWSEEDGAFVATVAEFPSLLRLDSSRNKALDGVVRLVDKTIKGLVECGQPVPEPYSKRKFSGNIRLRMPSEQHRNLAIQAAEEGVSLNRLLCSLISRPQVVSVEWQEGD